VAGASVPAWMFCRITMAQIPVVASSATRTRKDPDCSNYYRLHGELDWQTPAERYDGTPFTDRGFEHVPALHHLQGWLAELRAA